MLLPPVRAYRKATEYIYFPNFSLTTLRFIHVFLILVLYFYYLLSMHSKAKVLSHHVDTFLLFLLALLFYMISPRQRISPKRQENGNWRQVGAEARPEGPAGGLARREEIPGKDVLDDFFPLLARAPMQATRNPPMNSQPPPAPLPPVSPQMQLGVP